MTSSMTHTRRAFTLVELLIVIGIIALLVSILIPTVSAVRRNGYATDSAAQIKSLQAAIMEYHNTFKAYPGPLAEEQLGPDGAGTIPGVTGKVTGTENLVLGLLGGLEATGTPANPARYNKNRLGNGPLLLGMTNKNYTTFYDDWSRQVWRDPQDDNAKFGKYCHAATQDSNIPEFVDRFPGEELPVLYLRARSGRPGIIMTGHTGTITQYSMQSYIGYIGSGSGPNFTPLTLHGYNQNKGGGAGQTGSTQSGGWLGMIGGNKQTEFMNGEYTTTAFGYFRHPTLTPKEFPGNTPLTTGTPVAKDEYILISAGKDRTYGTQDDIVSFSR